MLIFPGQPDGHGMRITVYARLRTTSFRARNLSKPYSLLFEISTSTQVSEEKQPTLLYQRCLSLATTWKFHALGY